MSSTLVNYEHYSVTPRDDDEIEKQRRTHTENILQELKSVIIQDADYAQYCDRMQALGFEPYERDQLWHFNIEHIFSKQGPLAREDPSYRPRPGQIIFAHHVSDAISSGKMLLVEAGTGVGKTFGYLIPPIVAGRRIMVSTGTKALQDQLTQQDLPWLVKTLGIPQYHYMPLKGITNYICRYKIEQDDFWSHTDMPNIALVRRYADHCANLIDNDRYHSHFGEIGFLQVSDSLRSRVSCNSAECEVFATCKYNYNRSIFIDQIKHHNTHSTIEDNSNSTEPRKAVETVPALKDANQQSAPQSEAKELTDLKYEADLWPKVSGDHCFNFAARYEAKQRQIVAVNHSLLANAMAYGNFGAPDALLPEPDILVIDEAHTFPDKYREAATTRISLNELLELPDKLMMLVKAYRSNNLPVDADEFTSDVPKLELLVRTLHWGLSVYPVGQFSVQNFKYRHMSYPSSFELLGPCLIHPQELDLLGHDSFLRRAIAELETQTKQPWGSSANFFKSLGIYWQSGLAFGGDGDDENFFYRNWHLSKDEQRRMLTALTKLYHTLVEQYKQRYRLQSIEHLVPPGATPMQDVVPEVQGLLPTEPFFLALMRDLWVTVRDVSGLLRDKLPELDPTKQVEHRELSAKLGILFRLLNVCNQLLEKFMTADRNKEGEPQWDYAAWVEITAPQANQQYHRHKSRDERDSASNCELVAAPVDIGKHLRPVLQELQDKGTTIIFTSATITVNQQFNKFCRDLGFACDEVSTEIVPSPYNYEEHTCLLTSSNFPDIKDSQRISKCIQMVKEAIDCVDGGVFFLTTSYSKLQEAAGELKQLFGRNRTILVQGQATPDKLLARFKQDGRAILVGTNSFWEGVDVPGKALSLVIIDKLPFKTFADPLSATLSAYCEFNNGSSFDDISVPEAIIRLRQGVGRLIRKEDDSGALIIMDPRIHNSTYGLTFFNSLPKMTTTTSVNDLVTFLNKLKTYREG